MGAGAGAAGAASTDPHEDVVPLIDRQGLPLNEFVLQIFQSCVVELKLSLESAIGQASPALEHGDRLVENLLKSHCPLSSPKAVYRRRCRNGTGHSGAVIPHMVTLKKQE